MLTESEFRDVIDTLVDYYGGHDFGKTGLATYDRLLRHLSGDELRQAAELHMARSPYFPKANELLEAAAELRTKWSIFPDAGEAWAEVCAEMQRAGHMGQPRFASPLTAEVVQRIGGWRQVCLSDNQIAERARFMDTYAALLQRAKDAARLPPPLREAVYLSQRASIEQRLMDAAPLKGIFDAPEHPDD